MSRRRTLRGTLLGAIAIAGACAHQAPNASETVSAFGVAVEQKDYAAAYALTSASYRERVPFAAFRAQLEEGGAETQAEGRNLRAQAARGRLRARVDLDDQPGSSLVLVEEGGGWRIDGHPLEPWSQGTPRAALRSFVRALEQRRYDVVLRLSPTRHRAELTVATLRAFWEGEHAEENGRLLARLRAAMRSPIVESGDEAHMPYAERSEVRFVREEGLWKIEDPG